MILRNTFVFRKTTDENRDGKNKSKEKSAISGTSTITEFKTKLSEDCLW